MPLHLNYILRYHSNVFSNENFKDFLCSKFYMDNLVATSDDRETLKAIGHETRETLSEVGLILREWCSNNEALLDTFPDSLNENVKLLGHCYSPKTDCMSIKPSQLNEHCETRREVFGSLSAVFDPLDIIAPCMVRFKIFM